MSPRSGFGVWLQQSVQLTAVRAGTLFVHGGLAPELGFPGGKLSSLSALSAALVGATVEGAEEAEAAEAEALPHSALLGDVSSLVEYRSLHAPGARGCERVLAVLAELNLSRIAVGHTPRGRRARAVRREAASVGLHAGARLPQERKLYCDSRPTAKAERACVKWDDSISSGRAVWRAGGSLGASAG